MKECWINVWVTYHSQTGTPMCSIGRIHPSAEYARLAAAMGVYYPAFRLHVRLKGGAA